MSDEHTANDEQQEIGKFGRFIQSFYDNPWLLLVLGIVITFVSYTAWGWYELTTLEQAQLP